MKEIGILFQADMVRAIMGGRKTLTSRIIKPQPDHIYRLTDDCLECIHSMYEPLNNSKTDPSIPERRLQGGKRWPDILSDAIRGIWSQGLRGLVSVKGAPREEEGIPNGIAMPSKQESNQVGSSSCVPCVPWSAVKSNPSSETPRWERTQQSTNQSCVGDSNRELCGSKSSRPHANRREASFGKDDRRGARAPKVVSEKGIVQPKKCGTNTWIVPGFRLEASRFKEGATLIGRETWARPEYAGQTLFKADYDTDLYEDEDCTRKVKWKSGMIMPWNLARLRLEVVRIWPSRLQDMTEEMANKEGCPSHLSVQTLTPALLDYAMLWDRINGKKYPWALNPWVWRIEFRRIK